MKKVLNVLLSLMLLCVNILTPFVDVVKGDVNNLVSFEESGGIDMIESIDGEDVENGEI